MRVSGFLECTSTVPFLPSVLQCDFNSIVVRVDQPATNPWVVWMPVIVAALAAILGSVLGAAIGVGHSRKSREADEQRHLKERFAELIYKMDSVRRISDDHRNGPSTGRTKISEQGTERMFVTAPTALISDSLKSALAEVSAVLGYLILVAPAVKIGAAQVAATRVRKLFEVLSEPVSPLGFWGYWESDHDAAASRYDAARQALLLAVQSEPNTGRVRTFFRELFQRR